ncbi:hypothetical protein [Streptomyces sp. P9-A4]|uniref:hypothetical protein n=1 Tax=Streptomyces sp. P9-A4 TaxID=3072285 RepID=UPI002FC9EB9F
MKDLVIPLLIAVIGLAATVLGAILGARAARFGAEKNAETVRRQVQDQSAVEHGHWLRQQRLGTYESFLEAWDECLRITQSSAADPDADSTVLDELNGAAGRMAERARRIALLGPGEVTQAAESLTQAMQEDVDVSIRFVKVCQSALAAIEGRPVHTDAVADATAEYRQHAEHLAEVMNSYRDQGRALSDLDGHPLLAEVMTSIEQHSRVSADARDALIANADQLATTVREAQAMLDVLKRNKEARELSRERFTSTARQALGTPPIPE